MTETPKNETQQRLDEGRVPPETFRRENLELRALATECRIAQNTYFSERTPDNLRRAKKAEDRLDKFLFGAALKKPKY